MIIVMGGAPEFSEGERVDKEMSAILKSLKVTLSEIEGVYGFGGSKVAGEGGYFFAQKWAESNGVTFHSGNPNFNKYNTTGEAVEARNNALSAEANAMVLFVRDNSTGGNSIVDKFIEMQVPVFRIEQDVQKRDLGDSIKIYSKIAKGLLKNSVTLDVESTGLSEITDDVVEVAVVDAKSGKTLYNSFIFTKTPVNQHAFLVNNITKEMLKGQPLLSEAWKEIEKKIKGKIIVASNSKFDEKMICFGLVKQGVEPPENLWTCLQELYSKYSGQSRKGLNTARIANQLGIEPGTHRALTDAQAQASILKAMSAGVIPNLNV